jgi:signal transduction histidine kinase
MPISRALRGDEVHSEEVDVLLPAGKRLNLLVSASLSSIQPARSRELSPASSTSPPSKLLQRELEMRRREAEEASVRKTRFLAAVSHDIRTPANAINLMAEVIRRTAENPAMTSQIPELAHKLQANTRSMMELVSDLLDVARFDSGKMELLESEFSLGDLMGEECRQLLPLAQDKGLRLVVQPPAPRITSPYRPREARARAGNIIGNAIRVHGDR